MVCNVWNSKYNIYKVLNKYEELHVEIKNKSIPEHRDTNVCNMFYTTAFKMYVTPNSNFEILNDLIYSPNQKSCSMSVTRN